MLVGVCKTDQGGDLMPADTDLPAEPQGVQMMVDGCVARVEPLMDRTHHIQRIRVIEPVTCCAALGERGLGKA